MLDVTRERESGFTLVEIIVTCIIMLVLATISIPLYMNSRRAAAKTVVASDVTALETEIGLQLQDTPTWTTGSITVTGAGAYTLVVDGVTKTGTVNLSPGVTESGTVSAGVWCVQASVTAYGATFSASRNNLGIAFTTNNCT